MTYTSIFSFDCTDFERYEEIDCTPRNDITISRKNTNVCTSRPFFIKEFKGLNYQIYFQLKTCVDAFTPHRRMNRLSINGVAVLISKPLWTKEMWVVVWFWNNPCVKWRTLSSGPSKEPNTFPIHEIDVCVYWLLQPHESWCVFKIQLTSQFTNCTW